MKSVLKWIVNYLWIKYRLVTAPWRKLPDFIILGTQKGGTTSLYHYLNQHPALSLSKAKEVHYFDENFDKGINWYKSFFPIQALSKGKKTGEATPYYLFHPLAPERIKKSLKNVKFIILLRNPVHRAYSHYYMNKENKLEDCSSFDEALRLEESRILPDLNKIIADPLHKAYHHKHHSYLARGRYYEQLMLWFSYFNQDQFLFIRSEDLSENPELVLQQVCRYLEIAPVALKENFNHYNKGEYNSLDEDTYHRVYSYFQEDMQKLKLILGEAFSWPAVSNT